MANAAIYVSPDAPIFRGGIGQVWSCRNHECVLSGPFQTGKTYGVLSKLHALLCKYPNCRALMVRKTRKSILGSAVITYEKKVLPYPPDHPKCQIRRFGGELSESYLYPNGSRLIVGGLDDATKYLSAEYDYIYVNQAEEIDLDAWENLVGRATGRAGNAPYPQVLADCNPGSAKHWIKHRDEIALFETTHHDNPSLWDGEKWTDLGERTIKILRSMTGIRYQRGYLGLWVGAEGLFFDTFDPDIHGLPGAPQDWIKQCNRLWGSMDYGFSHANVIMLHGEIQGENRRIITIKEWVHYKHYPHEIAADFLAGLTILGVDLRQLDYIMAGGDTFNKTGLAEQTIAEQYAAAGIALIPGEFGPGSRVMKAHTLQRMLGVTEPDRTVPPTWFYVAESCPALAACLPDLIADPKNTEDVLKRDGDDPYDCLTLGIYTPGVTSLA